VIVLAHARRQVRKGTWYNNGGKTRTRVTQYHSIITSVTGLRWLGEFARVSGL
jgi:hypothetical protein